MFPLTADCLLFIDEAVSIQAGCHLLSCQGLEVVNVKTLGGQNGLHVGGDKLVVKLRGN